MQTHAAPIANTIQKRNPIVCLAIGWGVQVGGSVVGSVVAGITGVAILATVLWLAGAVVAGHFLKQMIEDVKGATRDTSLNTTLFYIPGLNQILSFLNVHGLVERARRERGITAPAKPKWMYLIVPWFAIPADLNDIAQ